MTKKSQKFEAEHRIIFFVCVCHKCCKGKAIQLKHNLKNVTLPEVLSNLVSFYQRLNHQQNLDVVSSFTHSLPLHTVNEKKHAQLKLSKLVEPKATNLPNIGTWSKLYIS